MVSRRHFLNSVKRAFRNFHTHRIQRLGRAKLPLSRDDRVTMETLEPRLLMSASFSGHVYDDIDQSYSYDPAIDVGIEGATVYIDQDWNSVGWRVVPYG